VHRFYQEQYQLNDGRQNRYVTGSDAVGLAMGVYDTRALPIYAYLHQAGHPHYAVADNFFQAAFGGSFLNHQWLIAASNPVWPTPSTMARPTTFIRWWTRTGCRTTTRCMSPRPTARSRTSP
jgi:phospholipase C